MQVSGQLKHRIDVGSEVNVRDRDIQFVWSRDTNQNRGLYEDVCLSLQFKVGALIDTGSWIILWFGLEDQT